MKCVCLKEIHERERERERERLERLPVTTGNPVSDRKDRISFLFCHHT